MIIRGHVSVVSISPGRVKDLLPPFTLLLKISIWALDLEKGIAVQRLKGEIVPKSAQMRPNGYRGGKKDDNALSFGNSISAPAGRFVCGQRGSAKDRPDRPDRPSKHHYWYFMGR